MSLPIFLICFIVFAIWLRVKMKRGNSGKEDLDAFLERENQANFARKQDISHLDYLSVNPDDLPFVDSDDPKEISLQNEVKKSGERKMIDLSAYTNTDLKEKYGSANLEELSDCDQSYLLFTRNLSLWGTYVYEKEDYTRAKVIMEYAKSIGSDISSVYTTLGNIYAREGDFHKVDALIAEVENSDFALKTSILKTLKLLKLEY